MRRVFQDVFIGGAAAVSFVLLVVGLVEVVTWLGGVLFP